MTKKFCTLTVVLQHAIREDDAQPLIQAIEQLKGVLEVTGEVAGYEYYAAGAAARADLRTAMREKLFRLLEELEEESEQAVIKRRREQE